MKEVIATATAKAIKEITLKDIYEAIEQGKQRQEDDFRYLNQRIDNLSQKIDYEIGQIRQEMGQFKQEIGQVRQEMGQIRQETSLRLDNITQVLLQIGQRGRPIGLPARKSRS
ncbi:MAG: hypothetical protein K6U11_07785 [bacterium]|nr:hypothetical protein [bacterium]